MHALIADRTACPYMLGRTSDDLVIQRLVALKAYAALVGGGFDEDYA